MDLLIFGYLIATSSQGHDGDVGFNGIFQPDVLNRRGAVALKKGTVHGMKIDTSFFAPPPG